MNHRAEQPDRIDSLVLDYLQGVEQGQPPDLEALAAQLPDDESRQQLRELVQTAEWARAELPEPFRTGMRIAGRYRLLEELGRGGFGNVWRAYDEKLGRDVALKMFHPMMEDKQLESTLRHERQTLARVQHDGVVRLLDSGRHEDTQFLAMEFVAGTTLEKVIEMLGRHGRQPDRAAVESALGRTASAGEPSLIEDDWFRTAARIEIGILWALAAAHQQQVVHRDLKPGNIVLRPGGRPVVLDFGLAGLADLAQGTLTGRLFGTAAYLAPEQLERMRTGKDVQTDIYQAGLLFYEMLTFRKAFPGNDRTSVLEAVRRGRITSPRQLCRDVPAELADVCMRALERNPAQRYATAEEFRDDLERWLDGETPRAARLGTAGRLWRGARRRALQHRSVVMAGCLVLLGTASTVYFAFRPEPVVARELTDGYFEVRTGSAGKLCAWWTSVDAQGRAVGTCPVRLQLDGGSPALQIDVPGGALRVRALLRSDLASADGAVRAEMRWFLSADEQAADFMRLMTDVAREASQFERVPSSDRVREIAGQLVAKGRGSAGIGALPLDELLR